MKLKLIKIKTSKLHGCSSIQRGLIDLERELRFITLKSLLSQLSKKYDREIKDLSNLSKQEALITIKGLRGREFER